MQSFHRIGLLLVLGATSATLSLTALAADAMSDQTSTNPGDIK